MSEAAQTTTTGAETTTTGAETTTTGAETTTTGAETTTTTTTTTPTWRDGLPDDLKNDATLSRFADVEALGRAHIEAHKLAKAKNAIPGADAPAEDWGKFYDALGRPKTADDYDVPMPELSVPEGASDADKAAAAEALKAEYAPFRALAHELGLTAKQAAALGQFEVDRTKAFLAKGEEEIAALKQEMGEGVYNARLDQAKAVFKMLGFPAEFADELDRKVGSKNLVLGFMKLADLTGEAPAIRGFGGDIAGGDANAAATLSEKMKDKTWRDKFNSGDPTVKAEYQRLMDKAKSQALGG